MSRLTPEQKDHFKEFGYVPVKKAFDPKEGIGPVIAEYHEVLHRLAKDLYAKGKIHSTYDNLPFGERITVIYAESKEVHNAYFDFSLPLTGCKPDSPFWAGPSVFKALTSQDLLDTVEGFIGPEIYSNPVQHVRIKPPESRAPRDEKGNVLFGVTPWHQDNGVVTPDADQTEMLTVWFPLMSANVQNGCLQVVPKSHRNDLLTHCPGYKGGVGLQIPEALFNPEDAVPVPLDPGDALFMHKRTIHSSLPNMSDRIRWSFDLRFNPTGQATGRGVFPGFIARSKADPVAELHSPNEWNRMWHETRASLATTGDPGFYNRWNSDAPICA